MPERIAQTDPLITEEDGSIHVICPNRMVPGAKAVLEKFKDYVPRKEAASWLSGGKIMPVDHRTGDPARCCKLFPPRSRMARWIGGKTRSQTRSDFEKEPQYQMVDIADPLGTVGSFRMNHLDPPSSISKFAVPSWRR